MDIKFFSEVGGSCYFAPNICSLLPSCLGLTFLRAAIRAGSSNADRALRFLVTLPPCGTCCFAPNICSSLPNLRDADQVTRGEPGQAVEPTGHYLTPARM